MSDPMPPMTADAPKVDESLITYTHVIYALHALAVLVGLTTFHTVVLSFVGGLPSIIAVIMNYARRSATVGTFLESHFRWQIRTFWFALLWTVVCTVLIMTIIGAVIGLPGFLALGIWIIYRVARGWLALRDRRPMYV
jgi:uncharacterized membrane protein